MVRWFLLEASASSSSSLVISLIFLPTTLSALMLYPLPNEYFLFLPP
jgi:hypothetical protein